MRETKFRAYIKASVVIFDVIEISWYKKTVRCVNGGQYTDPASGETMADYDFPVYDFDKVILMQFTGLKDKNGKEIDWWEDDVLQSIDGSCRIGIITFNEQYAEYEIQDEVGDRIGTLEVAICDGWEKVGNIHENPELLEANSG